jgi:ABC-type branched-subunit amino acid transport system substrate-binding protein
VAATKPTGLELVNLPVNAAQSDLSATAAELISKKPDAIVDGIELPLFNKLMLAVEAQGAKIPVTVAAVSVGPKTIKDRLAGVTSPVSILSVVNRTSKGFADYEADVKKYDPNQDSNDASVSAWLAIKYLFTKNVAAALEGKEITRQAVWDTTNSLKAVNTEGLMPPMDWSTPTKLLGGTVTRGFNTTGYAYKYAGGDWKLEGNAFSLGDGQK